MDTIDDDDERAYAFDERCFTAMDDIDHWKQARSNCFGTLDDDAYGDSR